MVFTQRKNHKSSTELKIKNYLQDKVCAQKDISGAMVNMNYAKKHETLTHLVQSSFISSNTFNQRNSEWINLICLMSFVDNRQWNSEA